MSTTLVRQHYQITLPADVRKRIAIRVGDPVEVTLQDDGEIVIKPLKTIHASQAWFWTQAHQAAEHEAEVERRAGKIKRAKSAKHLIHALDS